MPLHIVKLCVGVESVEDLQAHVAGRLRLAIEEGRVPEQYHQTRMFPKRGDEIVGQGSLYWVIKGQIQVRQPIVELRAAIGADGISRCQIVLQPEFILTQWQPRRAFQGWRYLSEGDAPADLADKGEGAMALPPQLRRELAELGLL